MADIEEESSELVRIRTELGMTIRAFAMRLGVPETRYKNWEYGRTKTVPTRIMRTARAMLLVRPVDLDRPRFLASFPLQRIRFAGIVPAGSDWGDPLSSEEFVEVDAKFESPQRFAAQLVGDSCWPALQQGDLTIWHVDNHPRAGLIVLAEREPDQGCTVKQLAFEEGTGRPILKPVNPSFTAPPDGIGWRVIARLVAVIRDTGGLERTFYAPTGLRPEDLA